MTGPTPSVYGSRTDYYTHRVTVAYLALALSIVAVVIACVAAWWANVAFRRSKPVRRLTPALSPARATEEPRSPGESGCWVIYNPVKIADLDTFTAQVSATASAAGYPEPIFVPTRHIDGGISCAREAAQAGASLIVVAGGDGTVRLVCGALAHTGIPIGIIPVGTGNLLARNLGIPIDSLPQAAAIAFTGKDTALDLGHVHLDRADADHPFLVIAGIGFDGDMMAGTSSGLKDRLGWGAYVLSGVAALRRPPMELSLRLARSTRPRRLRARTLLFASCGELTAGLQLVPGADPTDGWMEVTMIDVRGGLLGWVELASRVTTRALGGKNRVAAVTSTMTTERSQAASVTLAGEPRQVQVDGDPIGDATHLEVALDPHALIVRTR